MKISQISAMLVACISLMGFSSASVDFTLEIFGNANMDHIIDENDVAYVIDVMNGAKEPTDLTDANNDGIIDDLDIDQIYQIINGTEEELIIKDDDGDVIAIPEPIERVVAPGRVYAVCDAMRALNVDDLIVGVSKEIQDRNVYYPKLSQLSGVGTKSEPDYEAIIELDPDIVMISGRQIPSSDTMDGYKEKLSATVPVVYLALELEDNFSERVMVMGYIFNCVDDAKEYVNWHESVIDSIRSKTEGLSVEEMPRVFPTFYWEGSWNAYGGGYGSIPEMCVLAGGKNIGDDLPTSGHPEVDLEWIAIQDPEVIIVFPTNLCGYECSSDFGALRDSTMETPLLKDVSAVKNNGVYVMCANCFEYSGSRIVMIAQMAKWYHPEIFQDLDPVAIHQEYLDRFQHLDFSVSENTDLFSLS